MQLDYTLERWVRRVVLKGVHIFVLSIVLTACLASGQGMNGSEGGDRGKASYYADKFEGRTTASGELYDPEALTAAHPHLPFGTRVKVTRIDVESTPSVEVRINDRGPFADDRIIDLSKAAAKKIGMLQEGVVEVRLEVVGDADGENERENQGVDTGW